MPFSLLLFIYFCLHDKEAGLELKNKNVVKSTQVDTPKKKVVEV